MNPGSICLHTKILTAVLVVVTADNKFLPKENDVTNPTVSLFWALCSRGEYLR